MEAITRTESRELEKAKTGEQVSIDVISKAAKTHDEQGNASSSVASENFEFWEKVNHYVKLIPKIPAFVRNKYDSDDYDPLVVSIGPYHQGHPRLQFVEELKPKIWRSFLHSTRLDEQLLLNEALKVIQDLRSSYAKGSTDMYEDSVFAQMMLQDAAFVVQYIIEHLMDQLDPRRLPATILETLGRGVVEHVTRDLYVLENQIPFWFLKVTLHMRYGISQGDKLLKNFLNWSSYRSIIVKDDRPEPGNLVEAVRTVVIAGWSAPVLKIDERSKLIANKIRVYEQVRRAAILFGNAGADAGADAVPHVPQVEGSSLLSKLIHSFHSVTELKAKGIRIRRSQTNSLLDVSFHSGCFFSTLQLPAAWLPSVQNLCIQTS